jgi:hypothetical protein
VTSSKDPVIGLGTRICSPGAGIQFLLSTMILTP